MDGGDHARRRHARTGRGLRARSRPLRRTPTGGADLRRGRHQLIQQAGNLVPRAGGHLSAATGPRLKLEPFEHAHGGAAICVWQVSQSAAAISTTNVTPATVARTAPARATLTGSYFRLCRYATSASRSAAGKLVHFAGIGGFLADLVFAVISAGWVIQRRMSSAESFEPTPSSGLDFPPLPAIAWQTWHFCAS